MYLWSLGYVLDNGRNENMTFFGKVTKEMIRVAEATERSKARAKEDVLKSIAQLMDMPEFRQYDTNLEKTAQAYMDDLGQKLTLDKDKWCNYSMLVVTEWLTLTAVKNEMLKKKKEV